MAIASSLSYAIVSTVSAASIQSVSSSILSLLHNPLILTYVVPHLPTISILALASTSRSIRSLMYIVYPSIIFRRLDLASFPSPLLCAEVNPAEAVMGGVSYRHTTGNMLSVDDYYAAPLRRVFYVLKRKRVLEYVTTLVLDGLAVPSALLREILCDEPFNVRILSLRGVKSVDDRQLMAILRYLIRPSRPEGSPKLKGVYFFTHMEYRPLPTFNTSSRKLSPYRFEGVTSSLGFQFGQSPSSARTLSSRSTWINSHGYRFYPSASTDEALAQLLLACQGVIAFDATICHHGPGSNLSPRLATIALGLEGCQNCHSAPEQPLVYGQTTANRLPLLPPAPLFASTVKAAQSLAPGEDGKFNARCAECMKDRRCETCNVWWCENCYTPPSARHLNGPQGERKVHMGFCIQKCLVEALSSGAGKGGMWG